MSNYLFKTRNKFEKSMHILFLLAGHPNMTYFISFSITSNRSNSISKMENPEEIVWETLEQN